MKSAIYTTSRFPAHLPLYIAAAWLIFGGFYLLAQADQGARDTVRKHHLEDIERALYSAQSIHGTYPPYDQPVWCGILNAAGNEDVRMEIETALRARHPQYANPAKPFPADPRYSAENTESGADYFYWKRTPTSFELYAVLEKDPTGERNTLACEQAPAMMYDYGIASIYREPGAKGVSVSKSPL